MKHESMKVEKTPIEYKVDHDGVYRLSQILKKSNSK